MANLTAKVFTRFFFFGILGIAIFGGGVFVAEYKVFPYYVLKNIKQQLFPVDIHNKTDPNNRQNDSDDENIKKDNPAFVLLKELIARDYPEIQDEQIEDWQKVRLLRHWAYNNIDWGSASFQLRGTELFGRNATELFIAFLQDRGAVMCQGAAYTLMKLYQAYGFESYMYGMGKPIGNHSLTLVNIDYNGHAILTIQDPSFDTSFIDQEGKPYDFYDFLKVLVEHDIKSIKVDEGIGNYVDYLVDKSLNCQVKMGKCVGTTYEIVANPIARLQNGGYKYAMKLTLDAYRYQYGGKEAEIRNFLRKEGHSADDLIYLYLYPVYIYKNYPMSAEDRTNADKVMDKIISALPNADKQSIWNYNH